MSSKSNTQAMETEKIPRLLAQLAIPAVVAQIINLLYNIVDRIYIGHIPGVGAAALTGVGVIYANSYADQCLCHARRFRRCSQSRNFHGEKGQCDSGKDSWKLFLASYSYGCGSYGDFFRFCSTASDNIWCQ